MAGEFEGGEHRERVDQVARWYALTRDALPAMAAAQRWPTRLDHCFMRVCLDAALGAPWTDRIGKPAVATMSDRQLAAAIAVAEAIVAEPSRLRALNDASLRGRRAARQAQAA